MESHLDPVLSKAQVYLRSASVLLELEDLDSTASRAYFAMLYAAQSLLEQEGLEVTSGRNVRRVFREVFVEEGILPKRLADALDTAAVYQETADYEPVFKTQADEAEQLLQHAEILVTTAERYGKHRRPTPAV